MVKIQTGSELGSAILKALGINSGGVLSVDIGCKAGDVATVSIVRMVDDTEAGKVIEALQQYTLEHKPEDANTQAMETVARNLTGEHGGGSGG